MTGRYTCPIYYQDVVSLEKGGMIILYKLAELMQKAPQRRGTPPSRGHVSSMKCAESRTLPSRSHVSSMTGGCTCPIYYQDVVSVDKGSLIYYKRVVSVGEGGVIIRYKKKDRAYQKCLKPRFSRGHVSSMTREGVELDSPAAMFQA